MIQEKTFYEEKRNKTYAAVICTFLADVGRILLVNEKYCGSIAEFR
jgi:hypothetical protein